MGTNKLPVLVKSTADSSVDTHSQER